MRREGDGGIVKVLVEHVFETVAIILALAFATVIVIDAMRPDTCYEYAHSFWRTVPDEDEEAEYRATLYERCRIERAGEQTKPEKEAP